MKTAGPAFVWAGLALVELEGGKGPYQVEHVRPADVLGKVAPGESSYDVQEVG